MRLTNLRKKIAAYGLVEVLVGLVITGGILITITAVTIRIYKQVQDNELSDRANQILLTSIEFLKTPILNDDVQPGSLLAQIASGETRVYKIDNLDADNFSLLQLNVNNYTDLSTCSGTSDPFYIDFEDDIIKKPILCNKVVVERLASGGYMITSSLAYRSFSGSMVTSKIIGYRQYL